MARSTRLSRLRFIASTVAVLLCASVACASGPLLPRNPSLSRDKIAFLYADDIWTVSRDGGEAQRLTSINAVNEGPFFSPDGSQVLYSSRQNGSPDVYVVPASGGIPHRITWNANGNVAVGWTPDGKDILFASSGSSVSDFDRLYRARADGSGSPTVLPLPSAVTGSYSPDGNTLAYQPILQWEAAWKHYRGGQNTRVYLVDLKTLDLVKIPRENSNDFSPVFAGNVVYFLSDRNGSVSLFSYDPASKAVTPVVENHGLDLKTVAAGPGALVYEQFGSIHLYDLAAHAEHPVAITLHGDLPALEPHVTKIRPAEVQNVAVSPTGQRLVVEAHGDIFTLPSEKGDTRNLTKSPGSAERDPSWSPDGKTIAYFSDASGEYQLYLRDQDGLAAPKVIDLGPDPSYFYSPRWSPDSKHIAFYDKHLHLFYVDVDGSATAKPVKIDTGLRGSFGNTFDFSWSPDSKWVAYTRDLENQLHAVFFYSLTTHTSTQITDGMSNAAHPVFDPSGKYLYFTASTNNGPSDAGIDLSSLDRATSSSAYVIVLAKDGANPVPPESDDEKKADDKKDAEKKEDSDKSDKKDSDKKDKKDEAKDKDKDKEKDKPTVIDLPNIADRILSLPIPARNYVGLAVAKTGVLLLPEGSPVGRASEDHGAPIRSLWRFTLEKRQTEEVLANLTDLSVSFNGEKLFYAHGDAYFIVPTSDLKPGSTQGKPVNNGSMFATLDPRAEWKQEYRETWHIERDFFYDPHLHGLSIPKIEAKYQPYLDNLASRSEFTYLCEEMLGEIQVGHMFIRGPHQPNDTPKPGILGADYAVTDNRYTFAKIYRGQNWTPSLTAPLTLPGVDVKEGEFLLAVNGRDLHASDNLDSFFDATAGHQTVLHVGPKSDGTGSRDVTVIPIDSDHDLRNLDWIESNRHKVDQLSGGKVAYIYMPDTANGGFTNFNRYFYAQLDKQAVVLDERYNEGGLLADYVTEVLSRKPLSGAIERDGKPVHDPIGAIYGPKAMIINQSAGSGGDAMPWYFRKAQLGTLVGVKTWGGLVGIGGFPILLDGGRVTAPRYAIYGLSGDWEVEGHGIAPDVEVEELPKDVAAGHDEQLERAVAIVLEQLKQHPNPTPVIPPYPNFHKTDGLGNP